MLQLWAWRWVILKMINLIPIEEKKNIKKDFYLRLLTIFFVLLSFSVLIILVTLFPSYFNSYVKNNSATTKLEAQKHEPMPLLDQETSRVIKEVNNKLSLIENIEKNRFLVSQNVISEIMVKKMSDIKITRISYETDIQKTKKISIYGIAPSRERLLIFRETLEDDPVFSKVDLPISNFIKGSNIQFFLTLTPV
jgi:predicted membrane protein